MSVCSSEEKPVQIFWDDIHKQFTDKEGQRHSCPSSSKQSQNQRLNQTINDLKTRLANQHNDEVLRIDALQRAQAHNTSLLVEIKAKVDGILRQ